MGPDHSFEQWEGGKPGEIQGRLFGSLKEVEGAQRVRFQAGKTVNLHLDG